MYFPISAPHIFSAPHLPPPLHDPVYSGSTTPTSTTSPSPSLGPVRNSLALSSDGFEDSTPPDPSEDESQKIGEHLQTVEEEREDAVESAVHYTEDQKRQVIALSVAPRGSGLFATITPTDLSVWQSKPPAIVAHARRSDKSIADYGPNVDVLIRPDACIFVVQTSLGYLMTYSLASSPSGSLVYKMAFLNNPPFRPTPSSSSSSRPPIGANGIPIGVGEARGVREYSLQFQMVIKVDAGIHTALALEDELVVATKRPAAVQCVRWTPGEDGEQVKAEVVAKMGWIIKDGREKVSVTEMSYDRPMNLFCWITSDGRAYAVQKQANADADGNVKSFRGYCFHTPANSGEYAVMACIDARFSIIAVGCANATIKVYLIRDYTSSAPLSHTISAPSSSASLTTLTASLDGHCLFAGYNTGFTTFSVFGRSLSSTFSLSSSNLAQRPNEAYMLGTRSAGWLPSGSELLLLPSTPSDRIWCLEFSRSVATMQAGLSAPSIGRPVLITGDKAMLYNGGEMGREEGMWNTIQLPMGYLASQYPVRNVALGMDGRYFAIAGRRGLAHYSVGSGRWKTFVDPNVEESFWVRGGMIWFGHVLIAAVETERGDYELRVYSRELPLTGNGALHTLALPSPILHLSLTASDSLLVYTASNILYHFLVQPTTSTTAQSIRLHQVGQIAFHDLIPSPARVRAISWLLPHEQLEAGDPSRDVAVATTVFLVDGKLVFLMPAQTDDGGLKYDMRVLAQNVEWYALGRDLPTGITANPMEDALYLFDGKKVCIWPDVQALLDAILTGADFPRPVEVACDGFYPLTVEPSRGVVVGVEDEWAQTRPGFVVGRARGKWELFLGGIWRWALGSTSLDSSDMNFNSDDDGDLEAEREGEALHLASDLARPFEGLSYFPHALEMLLHAVLEEEMERHHRHTRSRPSTSASTATPAITVDGAVSSTMLDRVVRFLKRFEELYLDIVVKCARKTEVRCWKRLFEAVGDPRQCFEEALAKGKLSTAGGFLLVLEEMRGSANGGDDASGNGNIGGHEEVRRLMERAVKEGEWEVCRELARFLVAADEGGRGEILRSVVEGMGGMSIGF